MAIHHSPHSRRGRIPARFSLSRSCAWWLAVCAATPAWAQAQDSQTLDEVTISTKAGPVFDVEQAAVGDFDVPLAQTPQSITVLGSDLIAATGMQTLSQALRLDASMSDNYNTPGYVENLNVRGFMLSHLGNYQRNGLVVNNFAPVAFENKDSIEVLKGVAGLQSGVSAPGGLVNYVTKKPQPYDFTAVSLHGNEYGGSKLHLDTSRHLGTVGVRLNLAAESLHSHYDGADGSRRFASLAVDAPLTRDTRLTADLEYHRKSQPSVPGLGLLDADGDGVAESLPTGPINPRRNLNSQPWSLPYQTEAGTLQLGLEHRFSDDWEGTLAVGHSRTRINDRIAFPDGCGAIYPGLCANGDVDVYDYRNDGIRRHLTSWEAALEGKLTLAGLSNQVKVGVSGYDSRHREPALQAYNWVGTSNIYQPVVLPADPQLTTPNTNTDEESLAAFASLHTHWNAQWQSFVGLRLTRLDRRSIRTDGSRGVAQEQTVSTPWLGLTWQPATDWTLYASWGKGVELDVAPNRPSRYVNAGEVLPALKSTQKEVGVKWQAADRLLLSAAVFEIDKPSAETVTLPGESLPRYLGGAREARHRGLELNAAGRVSPQWSLQASTAWLDARTTRSHNPALQGQRVTNIPLFTASLFSDYRLQALPGLSLNALAWVQDGKRATSDGKTVLPRGWQIDAGARYEYVVGERLVQWTLNVENLSDHIYWREAAPTDWDGVYLFPSAPRTIRASVRVEW